MSARADTFTFSFDDGTLTGSSNNSNIQSYINSKLGVGKSVALSGAQASNNYSGDGHVVGPGNGSTSLTLGTSDGSTQHLATNDIFIKTTGISTEIDMIISGLKIYSLSFDYEIFPDGTCPMGRDCGSNWPDFTFNADGSDVFTKLAVQPAAGSHSPNSGPNNTEMAPQYIGQSGTYTFANGVSTLRFIDWPATIGIDNLRINTSPVPEPTAVLLFGTALAMLAGARLRGRKSSRTSGVVQ